MNAAISRHDAKIYAKEFDKYKQGKLSYQMTVHAIVWDEQKQIITTDKRDINFKSDFDENQLTQEMVLDITIKFYATLDYPYFL